MCQIKLVKQILHHINPKASRMSAFTDTMTQILESSLVRQFPFLFIMQMFNGNWDFVLFSFYLNDKSSLPLEKSAMQIQMNCQIDFCVCPPLALTGSVVCTFSGYFLCTLVHQAKSSLSLQKDFIVQVQESHWLAITQLEEIH